MQLPSMHTNAGMKSYYANAYTQQGALSATAAEEDEKTQTEEGKDASLQTDTFTRTGVEEMLDSDAISLRAAWRKLSIYDRLNEMLRDMMPSTEEDAASETERASAVE